MRVALLCPGPSLGYTWHPRDDYDKVFGVNRVASRIVCDVWAFIDWQIFTEHEPLGVPTIITTRTAAEEIKRRGDAERFDRHTVLTVEDDLRSVPPLNWRLYTATVAAMAAYQFGASVVDVYGADMKPGADWDGHDDPRNKRDEPRWATERQIWGELVTRLDDLGTSVTRWFEPAPYLTGTH